MSVFPVSQFRLLWELASYYSSNTEVRPVVGGTTADGMFHEALSLVRLDPIYQAVNAAFGEADPEGHELSREHWLTWLGCEVGVCAHSIPALPADPLKGLPIRPRRMVFIFYHKHANDNMTVEEVADAYLWPLHLVRDWLREATNRVQDEWQLQEGKMAQQREEQQKELRWLTSFKVKEDDGFGGGIA